MGHSYSLLDDEEIVQYEQWVEKIFLYLYNIRYGSKGFSIPFKIDSKAFDNLFLYIAPESFDPYNKESWNRFLLLVQDKCEADYTTEYNYDDEKWLLTIKNMDKNWTRMEKLANYVLIGCKRAIWEENDESIVNCTISNLVSNLDWFDPKNREDRDRLFTTIQKIGILRSVPYTLRELEIETEGSVR